MEDDLHSIVNIKDRRRIQNRISQRKRRERLKQMKEILTDYGEQGSSEGRSCSPVLNSRAASELCQLLAEGTENAIDYPAMFPDLLDTCTLLDTDQYLEPVINLNADETLIEITNTNPSGHDQLRGRDVLGANSSCRPKVSVSDASALKKENRPTRSADGHTESHADPCERPLVNLKQKADQMIDQLLSMYRFGVQLQIIAEDRCIVDFAERIRARFLELRRFSPAIEESLG
ncbi:uncharacterized protein N7503_006183 [Penicillium pulvis]|uniref:uncharacterized protein n=1 Tax=Penicillium pulvis TaxID=1562058 RepID=UPI002546E495|nr:uncharacterized protein N7503_006183 [Penicillium pulvis]KAJ5798678.1 hypothetical protein N7503_006183 [Penicillium pulvis]